METLRLIFYLGVVFSIFQMLWWLLITGLTSLMLTSEKRSLALTYITKCIKYAILMPVTVSFISKKIEQGGFMINSYWYYISIIYFITLIYIFSKIQKNQNKNSFKNSIYLTLKKSLVPFNFKLEIIVSVIAIVFLTLSLFFLHELFENSFIDFISQIISDIYNMFLFGFVFKIMGIFFVLNIFFKMINGMRVLFGREPLESQFKFYVNKKSTVEENNDFDDYEDVTKSNDPKKNKLID